MKKNITSIFLFLFIALSVQAQSGFDLGFFFDLSLSPDVQSIAYSTPTWEWKNTRLSIVNIKTGKYKKLNLDNKDIFSLYFFPDGKHIAFSTTDSTIKSCDLKDENVITHRVFPSRLQISSICVSADGKKIYCIADSSREKTKLYRIYECDVQNGTFNAIEETKASFIKELSTCGNDLLYSASPARDVAEVRMIRLIPDKNNALEEIIPEGNQKKYFSPQYHKASNQLIFYNRNEFCKMNMETKKVECFYKLKEDQYMMFYEITQKEEHIYMHINSNRSISIIDFDEKKPEV